MAYGAAIRIEQLSVQTPLSSRPGLGAQSHYEAPGGIWVTIVQNAMINIGLLSESVPSRIAQRRPWDTQTANGRSTVIDCCKSLCDCRKALSNGHHDRHYLDIATTFINFNSFSNYSSGSQNSVRYREVSGT